MTQEQLEVLMEYIDACIDDGLARANDSAYRAQTGIFKDEMQKRLYEVFVTPVPMNQRSIL